MNLTPTGFGVIVAILLVLAVIVVIADELRTRHEDDFLEDERLEQSVADYHCVAHGHYYGRHPRIEATRRVWTCLNCGVESFVTRADVFNQDGAA